MRKLSGYGPSLIVLITAALVLIVGPRAVQQLTYEQTKARIVQARLSLESNNILEQLNQAYRDIARAVEPSVVHISAHVWEQTPSGQLRRALSTGSGWVFDDQGHIVTNHHVVQDPIRIEVQLHDGSLRDAELIGSDPSTDIAVIRVSQERLHPAVLAEVSDVVDQGDMVFAFGSPFDFRFSMSSGVVSGKGRAVNVIRDEYNRRIGFENFIQVDAAINPGNSGGPLTDYRGRVIGMNTAIATNGRRSSFEEGQFAGIGLAIPIEMIRPVVSQLIERGYVEKGSLGITGADLSAENVRDTNFNGYGVLVTTVDAKGPAAASGVQQGDIITHVNGNAVASMAQLQSVVSSMLPGEVAKLKIWRNSPLSLAAMTVELEVKLRRLVTIRGGGTRGSAQEDSDSLPALGIAKMTTSTPEVAARHGVQHRAGVLLEEIDTTAGLARHVRPGSIIVEVSERPVRNINEFLLALRAAELRFSAARVLAINPDGGSVSFDILAP